MDSHQTSTSANPPSEIARATQRRFTRIQAAMIESGKRMASGVRRKEMRKSKYNAREAQPITGTSNNQTGSQGSHRRFGRAASLVGGLLGSAFTIDISL